MALGVQRYRICPKAPIRSMDLKSGVRTSLVRQADWIRSSKLGSNYASRIARLYISDCQKTLHTLQEPYCHCCLPRKVKWVASIQERTRGPQLHVRSKGEGQRQWTPEEES
jgi:hypothetical protein